MTASSQERIADFLAQRTLALVGVSRGGRKFGNAIWKELRAKGYTVFAVHPEAERIDGERCWPDLASLPVPVGGVVIVVRPEQTERVVADALRAGIRRVWMQQGSESPAALRFCEANGIVAVQRECVLMFAEPVTSIHRVHRWVWRVLGKLPA
jgi:predicted CoA-binding protein